MALDVNNKLQNEPHDPMKVLPKRSFVDALAFQALIDKINATKAALKNADKMGIDHITEVLGSLRVELIGLVDVVKDTLNANTEADEAQATEQAEIKAQVETNTNNLNTLKSLDHLLKVDYEQFLVEYEDYKADVTDKLNEIIAALQVVVSVEDIEKAVDAIIGDVWNGGYIIVNKSVNTDNFASDETDTKVEIVNDKKQLWFKEPLTKLKLGELGITHYGSSGDIDMRNLNTGKLADMSYCMRNTAFNSFGNIYFPESMPALKTLDYFSDGDRTGGLAHCGIYLPKDCPELESAEYAFCRVMYPKIDWSNANCPKLKSIKGFLSNIYGSGNFIAVPYPKITLDFSNSRFDSLEDTSALMYRFGVGTYNDILGVNFKGLYAPNIKNSRLMFYTPYGKILDLRGLNLKGSNATDAPSVAINNGSGGFDWAVIMDENIPVGDYPFFDPNNRMNQPTYVYYPEGVDISAWNGVYGKPITFIPYSETDDPFEMAKTKLGI